MTPTEREADLRMEQKQKFFELSAEKDVLKQQTEKLASALEKLSAEEREAIQLFFFEGLDYNAITRVQPWSRATCKRRISTGVHKVALMLFGQRALQNVAFVR